MTISSSAKIQVGAMAETVYGTTPATPALVEIPCASCNLKESWTQINDTDKHTDRIERYVVKGNKAVTAQMTGKLQHLNHDVLFESLFYGAFATNVLKPGSTRKSLVLEVADSTNNLYRYSNGAVVDSMEITIPLDGPVTFSADLVGKSLSAFAGTSVDTVGGYTVPPARTPLLAVESNGFIKEGGTVVAYMSAAKIKISNQHTSNYALGSRDIYEATPNTFLVTGEITAYFEDATLYNKCRNSTASSLDLKISDATNTIQIFVPNVAYTDATVEVPDSGPVLVKMPFRGLYSAGSLANIVITKS